MTLSDLQQFVYKLSDDKILAYADVFRFDYRRVGKNFKTLSQKVSSWVKDGTLPDSYRGHVDYLNLLARLYGESLDQDDSINAVGNRWMDAFGILSQIIDNGCPIVPIFQSTPAVAGERQVDNEFRIGVVSPMSKIISELSRSFADKATKISSSLKNDHPQIRPPIDVFTIFTYGPNMFWEVRGEADPGITFLHHNSIEGVARVAELPLVKRLIDPNIDTQKYVMAAVTETCRHETAHKVLSPEDDVEIRKALATSEQSDVLEEIKAETVGVKLASAHELDQDNLSVTVAGKLGTLLDYLAHKEDENYLVPAAVIFSQLFDDQLVSFDIESQRLIIGDHAAIINSIDKIGNDVLHLYQEILVENSDKKSLIDNFVQQSAGKLSDPNVLKLIALCRNSV